MLLRCSTWHVPAPPSENPVQMFQEVRPSLRQALLDSNGTRAVCRDTLASPARHTRVFWRIDLKNTLSWKQYSSTCLQRLWNLFTTSIYTINTTHSTFSLLSAPKSVLTLTIIHCGSPAWDQTHLSILKALAITGQTDGYYLVLEGRKRRCIVVKPWLYSHLNVCLYKYFSPWQEANSYHWKTEVV